MTIETLPVWSCEHRDNFTELTGWRCLIIQRSKIDIPGSNQGRKNSFERGVMSGTDSSRSLKVTKFWPFQPPFIYLRDQNSCFRAFHFRSSFRKILLSRDQSCRTMANSYGIFSMGILYFNRLSVSWLPTRSNILGTVKLSFNRGRRMRRTKKTGVVILPNSLFVFYFCF